MKLWILKPINPNAGNWDPWYDKTFGFVVCAPDEAAARALAHADAGDENRGEFLGEKTSLSTTPWLDAALSTCIELVAGSEARVVMYDHHSA